MALAPPTVLVTLSHEGRDRSLWPAGLLTATVCAAAQVALFPKHASAATDM